jgi:hypothetical protein
MEAAAAEPGWRHMAQTKLWAHARSKERQEALDGNSSPAG